MEGRMPNLHSPTSPASPNEDPPDIAFPPTEAASPSVRSTSNIPRSARSVPDWERAKKEEAGLARLVPTEPGEDSDVEAIEAIGPDPPQQRQRFQEPCPEVITGSKLDKSLKLPPNMWMKIGRQPKAAMCLNDPGVSRDQCSLKWDYYQQRVELRIDTPNGNLVNGTEVQEQRIELHHGDRLRVQGKRAYEFIIDLRPVGLGFGDPKRVANDRRSAREDPEKRNQRLREQLHTIELQIQENRAACVEEDEDFYAVEMRRRLRQDETKEKERLVKFYIEDAVRLKQELEDKRQQWLARLEEEYRTNQEEYAPIVRHVADLQDKLEKLQLKKDELARSIHPERYAVADVALELPSPAESRASSRAFGGRAGEESGEEDAFAGLSGLEDNREASDVEEARPPVKSQPKVEVGDEPTKVLKREGSTAAPGDEPAAKQPRQGGDGETWVCEERGPAGGSSAGAPEPGGSSAAGGLEGRVLD